jgi:hypothetical protein
VPAAVRRKALAPATAEAEDASIERDEPLENTVKIRLFQRALSLALATVLTLGLLGGIDHLAGSEPVSAVWASAVMTPLGRS